MDNGTDADASVLLVRPGTRRRVASMFVRSGARARLRGVPTGVWQVQFHLGHGWRAQSSTFCERTADSRFQDLLRFGQHTDHTAVGDRTSFETYSLTLHPVIGGNAAIAPLDSSEFADEDDDGAL